MLSIQFLLTISVDVTGYQWKKSYFFNVMSEKEYVLL